MPKPFPAFARQTGKACSSCHFQHYPLLNDFGADYKAGGYVDIKNKPLAGKDLSLADSLYASVFTKVRYQKSNGDDQAERRRSRGEEHAQRRDPVPGRIRIAARRPHR